ncbi:MAG: cell division protein FtsQ/DivIB, partial [Gaiellaceae bacterium]
MPANGLRVRLRGSPARMLAILALVSAAVLLLYAAARLTALFALTEVEVTGGSRVVREAVRQATRPFVGESLVALDQDELRRQLEALPTVHSLRVDRAFPHTLRIAVVPERPLAVVRSGGEAWLVSDRGRVIRAAGSRAVRRRVTIWASSGSSLTPGGIVQDENVRVSLEALRRLPARFPERVYSARAFAGAVTLVVSQGTELRLGQANALALKLAVAARVLRTIGKSERAGLAYLDVA